MLDKIFSNSTFTGLEKALNATKVRAETIAHNIANSDTPNFKRSYVEFEQYMYAAMNQGEAESDFELRRTRRGHFMPQEPMTLDGVGPVVVQDASTTLRLDGNNVDIEHEMNEYAKNMIHYNTLVEQLNSEVRRVRTALGRGV